MKKPTLVLMIIVLSVFMSANVTLGKGWKYFKGTYAMSATGSCIHSENGYVWGNFIDAVVPGVVYAGTTVSNGTWVFKKDGTGTYSYIMYATVTPPVQQPEPQDPPCTIPGGIRIFEVNEYTFTYEVTHSGNITIETQEGDTLEGTISENKKTIVLLDEPHEKGALGFCPWYSIICTATRTLTRMGH
jgi:hypothetical protein